MRRKLRLPYHKSAASIAHNTRPNSATNQEPRTIAPVMTIDGEFHGHLDKTRVGKLLDALRADAQRADQAGPGATADETKELPA